MNDGPPVQPESSRAPDAKPSIAEVAAWLRRAADQRQAADDLADVGKETPSAAASAQLMDTGTETLPAGPAGDGAADAGSADPHPSDPPATDLLDGTTPDEEPGAPAADVHAVADDATPAPTAPARESAGADAPSEELGSAEPDGHGPAGPEAMEQLAPEHDPAGRERAGHDTPEDDPVGHEAPGHVAGGHDPAGHQEPEDEAIEQAEPQHEGPQHEGPQHEGPQHEGPRHEEARGAAPRSQVPPEAPDRAGTAGLRGRVDPAEARSEPDASTSTPAVGADQATGEQVPSRARSADEAEVVADPAAAHGSTSQPSVQATQTDHDASPASVPEPAEAPADGGEASSAADATEASLASARPAGRALASAPREQLDEPTRAMGPFDALWDEPEADEGTAAHRPTVDAPGEVAAAPAPSNGEAVGSRTSAGSDAVGSHPGAPPRRKPSAGGSSSLFDLDLAELAARARASALREASTTDATETTTEARDDPTTIESTETTETTRDLATAEDPEADVADRTGVEAPAEPVTATAPALTASRLEIDTSADQGDVAGDVDLDDAPVDDRPKTKTTTTKAVAATVAALRQRRSSQPRYPRGQLRERIGILRRVRAMLGVVVLTVLLGIAAGAAIGAFLLFLSFAVRSAISAS